MGNIQPLSGIWLKLIYWTGPKTEGSKCHLGDPNNASDIWGYLWVSKRQIWNCARNCVQISQQKMSHPGNAKIRNTRQPTRVRVLSLGKLLKCFDVRRVYGDWWGRVLKLGHKGCHFVKSLNEKHCKKHEAHFQWRGGKNSSSFLGQHRLPLSSWL